MLLEYFLIIVPSLSDTLPKAYFDLLIIKNLLIESNKQQIQFNQLYKNLYKDGSGAA